jgi:hypothetical protein
LYYFNHLTAFRSVNETLFLCRLSTERSVAIRLANLERSYRMMRPGTSR